MHEYVLLIKMW